MRYNLAGALVLVVVAACTMGAGAYAQGDSPGPGLSGEINLGTITPLTGDLAQYGEEDLEATRLAISDFNEYLAGKGAGWSINLVVEDSQTLPTVALEKLQALHARNIKIVLGPETSSSLQNMKGYADSNGILLFSCCSTSPLLAISGDTVFRMAPDDSNQGAAIGKLFSDTGMEVMVPVWRADSWGVGLEDAARESFASRGGIVSEGISYNPDGSEFSAETSLLADTVRGYVDEYGADRVGVLYIGFGEVLLFMQSASVHDVLGDVRWFGSDANTKESSLVNDAVGLQFVTDTRYTTVQVASGKNDLSRHVDESVNATIGRVPSTYASSAYDTAWVVGLAIEQAQSTDVKAVSQAIPAAAAGHTGALGSTRLNDYGDLAQTNYDIWDIRGGSWTLTGTYFSASDAIELEDGLDMAAKPIPDGTIQIGGLLPITGDGSNDGADIQITVDLAESDFNDYLEANGAGWRLEILVEDTATSPAVALEKLSGLKARGVNAIVGTYSSGELKNVMEFAESNDMLLISYASGAQSLAIAGDNVFRFVPSGPYESLAIAKYLKEIGVTNLVPIWRDDAWGEGIINSLKSEIAATGGVMDEGVRYSPGTTEFSTEVAALADLVEANVDEVGAGRVAVAALAFGEIADIMQPASQHESLSEVLWYGTDAIVNNDKFSNDPAVQKLVDEAGLIVPIFVLAPNPVYDEVVLRASEVSGRTPVIYAIPAYDAVWVIGLSMLAAGSAETGAIVSAMPGVLEEYSGALGPIVLNAAGDLDVAAFEIYSVNSTQWTLIGTYDSASDSLVLGGAAAEDEMAVDEMAEGKTAGDAIEESGGCLIATAAYGSELAPQVQFLREIRDGTLLSTASGTSFMAGFNQIYYSFSPAVADLERENAMFRDAVRAAITPALYMLGIMTLADQGSDVSVIAFGIIAIAGMAGIYAAGPVLAVRAVSRRMRNR